MPRNSFARWLGNFFTLTNYYKNAHYRNLQSMLLTVMNENGSTA